MGVAMPGVGVHTAMPQGGLIDRCRQGSWQQVDCSFFVCVCVCVLGGWGGDLSCDESVGLHSSKGVTRKKQGGGCLCACVCVCEILIYKESLSIHRQFIREDAIWKQLE